MHCTLLTLLPPQKRNEAKQIAYGLLYGKGPIALAIDLKTSEKEAEVCVLH